MSSLTATSTRKQVRGVNRATIVQPAIKERFQIRVDRNLASRTLALCRCLPKCDHAVLNIAQLQLDTFTNAASGEVANRKDASISLCLQSLRRLLLKDLPRL